MSTTERRAREKAQRRREILDAARQEFFERGFHRPTVDDVAARAEVPLDDAIPPPVAVRYFPSSWGLIEHAADQQAAMAAGGVLLAADQRHAREHRGGGADEPDARDRLRRQGHDNQGRGRNALRPARLVAPD